MKPGIGRPIVFFVIVTCLASTPLVAQSAPGLPAEYLALESGDANAARLAPPEAWRAFPGESLVRAGNLSAFWLRLPVVSSARSPALLIETVEVSVQPFCDVTEEFALAEGEGSFADWKRGHIAFFTRNGGFDPQMMLVCERFTLIEDYA